MIDPTKVRDVIVQHLDTISNDDLYQIESIEALDQLELEKYSESFINERESTKQRLRDRSLRYKKLSNHIKQHGCSSLLKLRIGLVKEFDSNGMTYITSKWNYLGCVLIAVIDGFRSIGIESC